MYGAVLCTRGRVKSSRALLARNVPARACGGTDERVAPIRYIAHCAVAEAEAECGNDINDTNVICSLGAEKRVVLRL